MTCGYMNVYVWKQHSSYVRMHCVEMHEIIARTHGGLGFYFSLLFILISVYLTPLFSLEARVP